MKKLNEVLQELGISKVKLAKYLGVSRQMVYNYLEMDDISKWPKEKKILLFKLLNIEDGNDQTIDSINITTEYLLDVEGRLNQNLKQTNQLDNYFDLKSLTKDEQGLINDITYLIKEKFVEEKSDDTYTTYLYLYHFLQAIDNIPEIKYILGYMSKSTGFTKPNEYSFDETKQFIFEGIFHSAFVLYNNGGISKSKVMESHKRFVEEIEAKTEEKLSRTQQLNTFKIQALKELGYSDINSSNASEVLEKIAEIQGRKV
jgi:predicted transcriptional regulator/uncharacterized protein YktA (UPF0223 family)